MSILQKVLISDNERLDVQDFNNISNFANSTFAQLFDKVFTPTTLILEGFTVWQDSALTNDSPTVSPVYIKIAGSRIIHTTPTDTTPTFFVGSDSLPPTKILLTNSASNYIELDLTTVDEAEDTRAFWDPTANNNTGKEFSQVVNTVTSVDAVVTSNTSGFSGGNSVPIAKIVVNSSGTITSIYDKRNLFFSLSRQNPYDDDYQYAFPEGRLHSIHTLELNGDQGFYLHTQLSANTTWTIVHNLGIQFVDVEVYDLNGLKVSGGSITSITATSTTTTTIVFGSAQDGYAAILTGPSSRRYIHTQGSSSTTWTVTHNLNSQYVNVEVYDSSNVSITNAASSIVATSANVLTVTLGVADTGKVIVTLGPTYGYHLHTQGSSSAAWSIDHNLGFRIGTVTFYNSSGNAMILPTDFTCTNANHIDANFGSAYAGYAIITADNGGTYISDEIAIGNSSTTACKVVSAGTTSIQIYSKQSSEFTTGETLIGESSFAARTISTIKETFKGADKSITNLKDDLDAIKTELTRMKFGTTAGHKYWFEDSPKSLADIGLETANQVTTAYVNGGGTIGWNSATGQISATANFTIRILGTAFINTIQSTEFPITLANAELITLDLDPNSTTNIVPVVVATASFASTANRVILARREGDNLIVYEQLTQV